MVNHPNAREPAGSPGRTTPRARHRRWSSPDRRSRSAARSPARRSASWAGRRSGTAGSASAARPRPGRRRDRPCAPRRALRPAPRPPGSMRPSGAAACEPWRRGCDGVADGAGHGGVLGGGAGGDGAKGGRGGGAPVRQGAPGRDGGTGRAHRTATRTLRTMGVPSAPTPRKRTVVVPGCAGVQLACSRRSRSCRRRPGPTRRRAAPGPAPGACSRPMRSSPAPDVGGCGRVGEVVQGAVREQHGRDRGAGTVEPARHTEAARGERVDVTGRRPRDLHRRADRPDGDGHLRSVADLVGPHAARQGRRTTAEHRLGARHAGIGGRGRRPGGARRPVHGRDLREQAAVGGVVQAWSGRTAGRAPPARGRAAAARARTAGAVRRRP